MPASPRSCCCPQQVLYFSCTLFVVFVMFQRIRILRILLHASKWTLHKAFKWQTAVEQSLTTTVMQIHRNPIVFFTKRCVLPHAPHT